ncbi:MULTISPECIES: hypothetical protein [Halobacterium]|uniref:Uncharacterized protein n=4 Tax=Halobacterium salinarum TaxID=2242 RepID=Q9HNT0_HALSA|nr:MULTISPECIES: hypothetical protein [Halobacterium]AAG20140.1 hypothetical protein VNG_1960H [Halobacterium salinarum NRC-1]MBB6089153.1 hypothetical protein [Halobacterium salinarum]MCF2166209.1 hypothetical protein [Halobacterium salinarum]MCF2167692.1 hypothetical protein [Halobacterium salinarum]MCF2208333.1 hypothetical protein [Halobacterium salinarum]
MGVIVYDDPRGDVTEWPTDDDRLRYDEATEHWLVKTGDGTVRRIPRERVFYVEQES